MRPDFGRNMYQNSYVALDLETTGLNPKTDKIIEIGAVKVENGTVQDTFWTFVNPGMSLSEHTKRITHITDEMVADAPLLEEVWESLMDFLGEEILLGHRILFDYSFLKKEAVNRKYSFERKGIDTLKIARQYLPELPSRKLEDLCLHYGIVHNAHRALEDAKANVELYHKLVELFYQNEALSFEPQLLKYDAKKESPITKAQKEQLAGLWEVFPGEPRRDMKQMTRSEASREVNRLKTMLKQQVPAQ